MKLQDRTTIRKVILQSDLLRRQIFILLILFIAIGLRLYQLGAESLWQDEILSIQGVISGSTLPPNNLVRPTYFVFLRLWMLFGMGDAWLRGLSVLFDLGSVFLIFLLGYRLHSKAAGLIAALLFALSPLAINYAQEVRMYALGTFLGLVGTLALVYAQKRPKIILLCLWAVSRFLMLLTLPLSITLLLTDAGLLLLEFRRKPRMLLTFGKFLLLIGALWSPSFILTAKVATGFASDWATFQPRPTAMSFSSMLVRFTTWPLLPPPFLQEFAWLYKWFFKGYAIILTALVVVPLINKKRSRSLGWLVAWTFLPQLAIFIVSHVSSSLWVERYLLFTIPYALILIAVGFIYVWQRQKTLAYSLLLVYLIAVNGGLVRSYTTMQNYDWRSVVQMVSASEKSGDIIAIGGRADVFDYYYQGPTSRYILEPLLTIDINMADVETALQGIPPIESRLWLLYSEKPFVGKETNQIFGEVVKEKFVIHKHQKFKGIEAFLVTLNPTSN